MLLAVAVGLPISIRSSCFFTFFIFEPRDCRLGIGRERVGAEGREILL